MTPNLIRLSPKISTSLPATRSGRVAAFPITRQSQCIGVVNARSWPARAHSMAATSPIIPRNPRGGRRRPAGPVPSRLSTMDATLSELEVDELTAPGLGAEDDRIKAERVEHTPDVPGRPRHDLEVLARVLRELDQQQRQ